MDNRNDTDAGGTPGMASDGGQQQDRTVRTDRQQNQQGRTGRDLDQDRDADSERDSDRAGGQSIDKGNMGSGTGSADR